MSTLAALARTAAWRRPVLWFGLLGAIALVAALLPTPEGPAAEPSVDHCATAGGAQARRVPGLFDHGALPHRYGWELEHPWWDGEVAVDWDAAGAPRLSNIGDAPVELMAVHDELTSLRIEARCGPDDARELLIHPPSDTCGNSYYKVDLHPGAALSLRSDALADCAEAPILVDVRYVLWRAGGDRVHGPWRTKAVCGELIPG